MAELSIIIPAYNAENQITNCLDCLVNQINCTPEIIVVNDCSKDNTEIIIKNYATVNPNIKIINNRKNVGPGICRNIGLKQASGNYIGFVDSDDWVDLNFYSSLLKKIKIDNSDIAIAGISNEYNNSISTTLRYNYEDYSVIDGKIGLKLLTKSSNLGMFITPILNNKIYNSRFLEKYNIHCCDNKSWQDDFFSFFAILHASQICIVPEVQYHYLQRENSITHRSTNAKNKIDNCIDVLQKIKKELNNQHLYLIYQNEYMAFVERCISSLLTMIKCESALNENLIYLFEKLMSYYNIHDIVSYLDNERIYNFFNL